MVELVERACAFFSHLLLLLWHSSLMSGLGLPYQAPLFRGSISGFETFVFFTVRGHQPLAQPQTWRTRVPLLVWIIPFDLSCLGDLTSSYATSGIALRVIWPHKPCHYVKVETPSGGFLVILEPNYKWTCYNNVCSEVSMLPPSLR
jgi:hypothetical protein